MPKSSNFFGQPIYGQLIKSLNRDKIVEISRKYGGEKYVKSFECGHVFGYHIIGVAQGVENLVVHEVAILASLDIQEVHYNHLSQ